MTQKDISPQPKDKNLAQAMLHDLGRSSLEKDGKLVGKSDVEIRRAGLKEVAYTAGVVAVGAAAIVGSKLWIDHQEAHFANDDQGMVRIEGTASTMLDEQPMLRADSLPAGMQLEADHNSATYVVPQSKQ